MCGFVGIINKNNPVDSNILKSMAATIAHRGPDEEGEYIDNKVGFFHKRLSIIDGIWAGHEWSKCDHGDDYHKYFYRSSCRLGI